MGWWWEGGFVLEVFVTLEFALVGEQGGFSFSLLSRLPRKIFMTDVVNISAICVFSFYRLFCWAPWTPCF